VLQTDVTGYSFKSAGLVSSSAEKKVILSEEQVDKLKEDALTSFAESDCPTSCFTVVLAEGISCAQGMAAAESYSKQ